MTMLEIPPGTFTMGSTGETPYDDERPAHEVTLTRPFYLADREVTVEQLHRFLDDADGEAAEKPQGWTEAWMKRFTPTPDCPVIGVNWFDAVLYCNWLSAREGRRVCYQRSGEKEKLLDHDKSEDWYDMWHCDFAADGYRLPTEAEWEYAVRAGSLSDFCFGGESKYLPQYAWFYNSADLRAWPGGSKLPNALGLFDVHGNVWEWCWDWRETYGADVVSDPRPTKHSAGSRRVLRGGAFYYPASQCRSAFRYACPPMLRALEYIGFRVCCGR